MKIPEIIMLSSNRVWRTYPGGKTLDKLSQIHPPSDTHFPEDWIASTTKAVNKERETITDEGLSKVTIDNKNYYLKNLFESSPFEMLGKEHYDKYGANTQFLLKFLDSAIRLHIQCHPTIPFAKKYLNSNYGKTEGYIILGSRPEINDPYIYMGFQYPPEKDVFRNAIMEQDTKKILSYFKKIPVKPGDVFLVPGGLPHAIGEGIFMIEIMEPTDLAVRIEFERGGYILPKESRFMGRDVDFALSMFDFTKNSISAIKENYFVKPELSIQHGETFYEWKLFDKRYTSCFRVNKLLIKKTIVRNWNSFCVGIVTHGNGKIKSGEKILQVSYADKFFIPYKSKDIEFETESEMEIIMAFPPEI